MTTLTRPIQAESRAPNPISGDRFVAAAAGGAAAVLVAVQLLAVQVFPPLAVFALLYVVVGGLVAHRATRRRLVAAVVLGLVHIAGSIPFARVHLAHPESAGSFLTEVFVWIAVLLVLVGAVTGLRGQTGPRRPALAVGAAVAGIAVVVSIVASAGVDGAERQPGDVTIEGARMGFPDRVEVAAGTAGLWLDNQDPFHHTLLIEGTDVRVIMPANAAVRAEVRLAPGSYRYYCDVPGHDGMEGIIDAR